MKWLKCCYCCCRCLFNVDEKSNTLDDSSSLIQDGLAHGTTLDTTNGSTNQVHAFYVPRRHSSFQPSSFSPISSQPGRSQSESCTSSDEESTPEQRGRCWSTIPATSATDITSLIDNRRGFNSTVNNRTNETPSGKVVFDRHILDEIAEAEQEDQSGPKQPAADIYGYLTFTTTYDEQEHRLTVLLQQATGLPKKAEEPYGTFVKMSLSPFGNKNFRMSRAVKKSLNPCYKEEHVFQTNRCKSKQGNGLYLRLSVYDCDRQGRHDALGHALIPIDRMGQNEQEHTLPLTPMSQPVKNLGQLLVGLLFSPIQSRLAIHVIKARHLRADPEVHKRHIRPITRDGIDTFCKVTLTCGGQKVKTCRSRSVAGSDPFYDFKTNFVVPPQYLRDTAVIVSVVTRSTLGRQGTTMGRTAALGPYVELGDGNSTQWGRMVQEGRSVVQWRNIYL